MIMIDKRDLQIAQLKQEGLQTKEIAKLVYPELPPNSGSVKVSRHLGKGAGYYLKQSREKAIVELGLNWLDLLRVFVEATKATKTIVHGAKSEESWVDEVPDHTVRMNAVKELVKYLPTEEVSGPLDNLDMSGMDELELTKAVFRKNK